MGIIVWILLTLLIIQKFYKNRALFKHLSKIEWIQYIIGLIVGITIAMLIIFGGKKLLNIWAVESGAEFYQIVIILSALVVGSYLFEKLMPEKIKPFYK